VAERGAELGREGGRVERVGHGEQQSAAGARGLGKLGALGRWGENRGPMRVLDQGRSGRRRD
jgi:hypothetical protein